MTDDERSKRVQAHYARLSTQSHPTQDWYKRYVDRIEKLEPPRRALAQLGLETLRHNPSAS